MLHAMGGIHNTVTINQRGISGDNSEGTERETRPFYLVCGRGPQGDSISSGPRTAAGTMPGCAVFRSQSPCPGFQSQLRHTLPRRAHRW